MPTVKDILAKYHKKIDPLDLELLIASNINKPREFALAHPEYKLTRNQELGIMNYAKRRLNHEPVAYILGQKEFYGLNFKVNQHTLIPRPESELLVERALTLLRSLLRNKLRNTTVVDVGTGSGNIIISIAKELEKFALPTAHHKLLAIDISKKALGVARQNARFHKVDKKIKFIEGDLLEPLLKLKNSPRKDKKIIIVANLPYLAKNIYASVSQDIKKYEPKSALLSGNHGLRHYEKLLKQLQKLSRVAGSGLRVTGLFEISPEQKNLLPKLLKSVLPDAQIDFRRDLAGKWRLAIITCV